MTDVAQSFNLEIVFADEGPALRIVSDHPASTGDVIIPVSEIETLGTQLSRLASQQRAKMDGGS